MTRTSISLTKNRVAVRPIADRSRWWRDLRAPEHNLVLDIRNAQLGIEPTQLVHRSSRIVAANVVKMSVIVAIAAVAHYCGGQRGVSAP